MALIKPKLVFGADRDSYIPPPYRAWCHKCKKGFMTLDECMDHVRANHQLKGDK